MKFIFYKSLFRLLILALLAASYHKALANEAELYWVAYTDGITKIMFSAYADEQWSEPLSIHDTETELNSLAVASQTNGAKTLVWTERRSQKMQLMKMRQAANAGNWSQPGIFSSKFNENFAATLVADLNNQLWLFWSANKGDLDDIYISRLNADGWSSPERIHPENKVPDIVPYAYLNEDYDVVVKWRSYNFVAEDYITLEKTYIVEGKERALRALKQEKARQAKEPQDLTVSDIVLPDFLPFDAFGVVHFPNNKLRQTERLNSEY